MKVTLIQPYYHNIWESLGVGYIASYCKKHYRGTLEINFFQSNFDSDETIIEEASKSDIIGFTGTSPTFQHGVRLARAIKKNNNIKSVFGGWHVTALGSLVFEDGVDQIVVGEGEKAFLDILNGNNEKVICGVKLDFDELVWPDREVIRQERTLELCEKMTNGLRIGSFQANRGCPFSCAFCAEKCMTGKTNRKNNPIRTRQPDDLCDEVEAVCKKYNVNYFKFVDATFDTSSRFVVDFCKEIVSRNIKTPWEVLIHASLADEEMFAWLEKANCVQVNIGVESGSDRILKNIEKGLNIKIVERVFNWAKKYNIKRRGFFVLGIPDETEVDHNLTEQLIQRIRPDVVGFTILCPYPGTNFYDHEKYKNIDWSKTDEYYNDFWYTERFTNQQLKDKQKYFTKKYENVLCERGRNEHPDK